MGAAAAGVDHFGSLVMIDPNNTPCHESYRRLRLAKILAAFFVLTTATGCTLRPWPPAKYAYELWSRPETSELETYKYLLECGFSSPFYSKHSATVALVASLACMEGQGFIYQESPSWRGVCKFADIAVANGCGAGDVPPLPDPRKRLESKHCHDFPNALVCKP